MKQNMKFFSPKGKSDITKSNLSQSPLLMLPKDIVELILEYLDRKALINAKNVCSTLCNMINKNPKLIEKMLEQKELLFKVLLIGDASTNKLRILNLLSDTYSDNYISTIGTDFKIVKCSFNKYNIKLQIWDSAGQERYRTLSSVYYKGAHAILYLYNEDDRVTFNDVKNSVAEIGRYATTCVSRVIGNTATQNAVVNDQEALDFCNQNAIDFYKFDPSNLKAREEILIPLLENLIDKHNQSKSVVSAGLFGGVHHKQPEERQQSQQRCDVM